MDLVRYFESLQPEDYETIINNVVEFSIEGGDLFAIIRINSITHELSILNQGLLIPFIDGETYLNDKFTLWFYNQLTQLN